MTFSEFAKNYKPLRFKFINVQMTERMPTGSVLYLLWTLRLQIKCTLNLNLTYFDLRFSMSSDAKKTADMAFLTHYIKDHVRNAENASRIETFRYWRTRLRYLPELSYVNSIFYSQQSPNHPKQIEADNYVLRWTYLLAPSPSSKDLIHGVHKTLAIHTLEDIS